MADASRLLAFAFAAADLLVELDGENRVAVALGAAPATGDPLTQWTGRGLSDLVSAADAGRAKQALAALAPGTRTAAIALDFQCGAGRARRGLLRAFKLPNRPDATACAVSWDGAVRMLEATASLDMLDARGLMERVGELMGGGTPVGLDVAFVAVPGLAEASPANARASARIEQVLQAASVGGASAARLSDERFALVRAPSDSTDIAGEIRQVGVDEGLTLEPEVAQEGVADAESGLVLRALRLALDGCLKDGVGVARFGERLKRTVDGAERFKATVRTREFKLAYQPIVDLDARAVHHFEALARFGPDSPAAAIRMAEELGLVEAFDIAVAEKALRQMRKPGFGLVKVAVNVSGASLADDSYVDGMLKLTAASPDIRKRLMIEVTETAALADLDAAERRLRALREAGVHICMDDFGVGAASFDYLRRLSVDVVKIDGSFVRDLKSDRSQKMIAHLVALCRDLDLGTVAEMVETEDEAATLKAMGVTYGQGWLFGRPAPEPVVPAAASSPVAARRIGAVSGWG